MVKIPSYDEEYYENCLEEVSRAIDLYVQNIQVLTAFWDCTDKNDELPCNLDEIERSIWLEDGRRVEPDIAIYEEGESFVFGELKGSVSDLEIEACINDLEKYSSMFYSNQRGVDNNEISPRTPRAVFLVTHSDHLEKVINRFKREYSDFHIDGVPVAFLGYQQYVGPGGNERLRIELEAGKYGDSKLLDFISKEGVIRPDSRSPYEVRSLIMYTHSRNFYYYSDKPPDPYTTHRMVIELDQYRISQPTSFDSDSAKITIEDVIESFKESHSCKHTAPRSSWIRDALDVLDEYDWISQEDGRMIVNWEEFRRRREIDDMHKFFAKEACRERAEDVFDEESEEKTDEPDIDEAQSSITDFGSVKKN